MRYTKTLFTLRCLSSRTIAGCEFPAKYNAITLLRLKYITVFIFRVHSRQNAFINNTLNCHLTNVQTVKVGELFESGYTLSAGPCGVIHKSLTNTL